MVYIAMAASNQSTSPHQSLLYIFSTLTITTVRIFRIPLQIENGISQMLPREIAILQLGGGLIKDIAFLDDRNVLVLWKQQDTPPKLLAIPYRPDRNSFYSPYIHQAGVENVKPLVYSDAEVLEVFRAYDFPAEGGNGFVPRTLRVSGREDRGEGKKVDEGTRVCVLAKDRRVYKVFRVLG